MPREQLEEASTIKDVWWSKEKHFYPCFRKKRNIDFCGRMYVKDINILSPLCINIYVFTSFCILYFLNQNFFLIYPIRWLLNFVREYLYAPTLGVRTLVVFNSLAEQRTNSSWANHRRRRCTSNTAACHNRRRSRRPEQADWRHMAGRRRRRGVNRGGGYCWGAAAGRKTSRRLETRFSGFRARAPVG